MRAKILESNPFLLREMGEGEEAASSPDAAALSMVREYLHAKGMSRTLECLYGELRERPEPTSRSRVARSLGLSAALKENKRREAPLDTLLEVVCEHLAAEAGATVSSSSDSLLAERSEPAEADRRRRRSKKKKKKKRQQQEETRDEAAAVPAGAVPCVPPPAEHADELELEDFEEDDLGGGHAFAPHPDARTRSLAPPAAPAPRSAAVAFGRSPVDPAVAHALRRLFFGEREAGTPQGRFPDSWLTQGIARANVDGPARDFLSFGLIQLEGGPCGILAAVQAGILCRLLAGAGDDAGRRRQALLACAQHQRWREAAAGALAEMLWRAGGGRRCRVCLPSSAAPAAATAAAGVRWDDGDRSPAQEARSYRGDAFTERLVAFEFGTEAAAASFLGVHMPSLERHELGGAVCVAYSLALSRGVARAQADTDGGQSTLMGAHGYCAQELVNLALTGEAASNVFDGERSMGETVMGGVRRRSQAGFVSLFEHYGYVEVGDRLKRPEQPVWVVCSESHYSVLFALGGTDARRGFALHYYDQLANQEDEIELLVGEGGGDPGAGDHPDLVPPLNHCVRTLWPGARVEWRGCEPLL